MSEKAGKPIDSYILEDKIMNPNIAKSEAEWWARNKIQELEYIKKQYIEGRCAWIYDDGDECWHSACEHEVADPRTFDINEWPYCPGCGKEIILYSKK
jgi:hypothetical protein